jgi:hypothetical protein
LEHTIVDSHNGLNRRAESAFQWVGEVIDNSLRAIFDKHETQRSPPQQMHGVALAQPLEQQQMQQQQLQLRLKWTSAVTLAPPPQQPLPQAEPQPCAPA